MSQPSLKGIDRHGLDASFEADETLKSNLIVEGQTLSAQHQPDAAADCFAQAAEIEERLSANNTKYRNHRTAQASQSSPSHIENGRPPAPDSTVNETGSAVSATNRQNQPSPAPSGLTKRLYATHR